jgi:hypothetical protein
LCFVVCKTTSELERAILTTLLLPVQKTPTRLVLSKSSLPFVNDDPLDHVCDACQQAKSHQLPYPKSVSTSKAPLELIFFDVWGPTCVSIGRNKYYISVIVDFSKFTSIYLLKYKSEVFQKFLEFQNLVERLFDRKILAVQTDRGGEYQKLNSF